jgi:hypothetical protein
MGCNFAAGATTLAECNATCVQAKAAGCSFKFQGQGYTMCSDCPQVRSCLHYDALLNDGMWPPVRAQRWLNPVTLHPEILPGAEPAWPPGFELPSCSSSDGGECSLGCQLAFNPQLAPVIPSPTPPPARPAPPAPWPNPGPATFNFSVVLSSHMVLQQGPGAAAVFGNVGQNGSAASISVTVAPSAGNGEGYTVQATVSEGRWKALLRPTASVPGVTYTVTAACAAGCGSGGSANQTVALEVMKLIESFRSSESLFAAGLSLE